ncbi:MAG: hypothetical protein JWL82_167 [Parcubacteria group bacterium]|nr:hypothetical protein [Parcubacteria group bacterium]
MSWASRKRFTILSIIGIVIVAVVGGTAYLTLHQAPSCVDHKQNQDEEGIDCGGMCTYLCSASQAEPSAKFVLPLHPSEGRTDIIASIENPNPSSAAKNLKYTIELYSASNAVVARKVGTVDLPPSSAVPVFVPNIFSGSATVARAFITFDSPEHLWFKYTDDRVIPKVRSVSFIPGDMPRVTATADNASSSTLHNVLFIVTVFGADKNALAASQTIVPTIPAHGSAPLVFTWTAPFAQTVSRIDVVPVIPLPADAALTLQP